MTAPFIFFDLGNVLLFFDREIGFRKLAALSGISADLVKSVIFDSGLLWKYETGELSSREFYQAYCHSTETRPDYDAFHSQGSDIFWLNSRIVPVVMQLAQAGHRLGLLSNICEAHWDFVSRGRFAVVSSIFPIAVLSYRVGALKPSPMIYGAAAEAAGVKPTDVLFFDDIEGHVAGARSVGFDAVLYTSVPALVDELRKRDVKFNY
jgi:putative hydrolase of the HAD superfamily